MTTLREAVTKAVNEAEDQPSFRRRDWYATFLASLRQSGYWIAPVDATPEMWNAGADQEDSTTTIYRAMRDAYIKESGQ